MRFVISLMLLASCTVARAENEGARLAWFQKVTEAPAITPSRIAVFKGHFYLCNRVGASHGSLDGDIEVRRSADMKTWESCGLIKTEDDDRDPHFVATDDKLFLYFGVWDTIPDPSTGTPARNKVRSQMSSTTDGTQWEPVQALYESGWWLSARTAV